MDSLRRYCCKPSQRTGNRLVDHRNVSREGVRNGSLPHVPLVIGLDTVQAPAIRSDPTAVNAPRPTHVGMHRRTAQRVSRTAQLPA
jgi:hypothetical protein